MKKALLYASFALAVFSAQAQYRHRHMEYPTSYGYNYNGFTFNDNGVTLTINTLWGGGSLSFPIGTIREGEEYVYSAPKHHRDRYLAGRHDRDIDDIDYSNPNLAMNKPEEMYTVTRHWIQKRISVSCNMYTSTDVLGNIFYKTETIERVVWVLE